MKNLNEKINEWLKENPEDTKDDFFCWLQGTEYPGSEVEYNGLSGQDQKEWWTIVYENGHTEDFYLSF